MFSPEPLAKVMSFLQRKRGARLQVAQSSFDGNIGLQNRMDVIRPNMDAQQVPLSMYARIQNGT